MLSFSHASENPGSWALSGPLLSLGNLRCHCRQKELWNPSNSSGGYYLLYQRKITLLPTVSDPSAPPPRPSTQASAPRKWFPPSFHFFKLFSSAALFSNQAFSLPPRAPIMKQIVGFEASKPKIRSKLSTLVFIEPFRASRNIQADPAEEGNAAAFTSNTNKRLCTTAYPPFKVACCNQNYAFTALPT